MCSNRRSACPGNALLSSCRPLHCARGLSLHVFCYHQSRTRCSSVGGSAPTLPRRPGRGGRLRARRRTGEVLLWAVWGPFIDRASKADWLGVGAGAAAPPSDEHEPWFDLGADDHGLPVLALSVGDPGRHGPVRRLRRAVGARRLELERARIRCCDVVEEGYHPPHVADSRPERTRRARGESDVRKEPRCEQREPPSGGA